MSPEQETELRRLARKMYEDLCAAFPDKPGPDTPDGQARIKELFLIISRPYRMGKEPKP